jgi:hypothetical protein
MGWDYVAVALTVYVGLIGAFVLGLVIYKRLKAARRPSYFVGGPERYPQDGSGKHSPKTSR